MSKMKWIVETGSKEESLMPHPTSKWTGLIIQQPVSHLWVPVLVNKFTGKRWRLEGGGMIDSSTSKVYLAEIVQALRAGEVNDN